jgi:nitroreductase
MTDSLTLLQNRNSAPRLTEPGPDAAALEQVFRAALRAPDHAWLQPTRFLVFSEEKRTELGAIFERALCAKDSAADDAAREKALRAPLRAPLLVCVICRVQEHPKVPRDEQLISSGCAAYAMLLAAEAQGFAGVWRTGSYATDPNVASDLGLSEQEEIVGFLYFGSRDGAAKTLPDREIENYVSYWGE